MVDVHERVDPRGGVVVGAVGHAVHHAGGAGGGGHGAGVEHAEGQRVVGLIAAPVGERRPRRHAQLGGGRRGQRALRRERGHRRRQQRRVDAVVFEQKIGARRAREVPQDTFRQAGRRSGPLAGQPPGDVVARQQEVRRRLGHPRLVLDHPAHLGGGEVARRVEQPAQGRLRSQFGERPVADLYGTAVAPDDRRTQHRAGGVGQYQAVHLVGDADRLHVGQRHPGTAQGTTYLRGRRHQVPPPHLGILLRPARPGRGNLQFGVGRGGLGQQPAAVDIDERCLDRGTAQVEAEQ